MLRILPPLALAVLLPRALRAQQRPALRVGFISIIPMAGLFVMEGRGWTKDVGLPLITKRFASGPAMVEALAMGALDVAYIGIGPAMLARARGIDVKVVAANVMEQVALVARGPLAAPTVAPATGRAVLRLLPLRRNQSDSSESKIGSRWSWTPGGGTVTLPESVAPSVA